MVKLTYSGQLITDLLSAKQKSIHTESARSAYKSILAQYGKVEPNTEYCHYFRGTWIKASEYKKRHGGSFRKITHNMALGFEKLKGPEGMKRRTGKSVPKISHKPLTKKIPEPDYNSEEYRKKARYNALMGIVDHNHKYSFFVDDLEAEALQGKGTTGLHKGNNFISWNDSEKIIPRIMKICLSVKRKKEQKKLLSLATRIAHSNGPDFYNKWRGQLNNPSLFKPMPEKPMLVKMLKSPSSSLSPRTSKKVPKMEHKATLKKIPKKKLLAHFVQKNSGRELKLIHNLNTDRYEAVDLYRTAKGLYPQEHKTFANQNNANKWINSIVSTSSAWERVDKKPVEIKEVKRSSQKATGEKKAKTKAQEKKEAKIKELEADIEHYEAQAKLDKSGFMQNKANTLKAKLEAVKMGKKYIAPKAAKKETDSRKEMIIQEAHSDWDNQAKNHLMYNREFRDKTLKACVERHLRNGGY